MIMKPKALTSLASKKGRCLSFLLDHMAVKIVPTVGGKVRKLGFHLNDDCPIIILGYSNDGTKGMFPSNYVRPFLVKKVTRRLSVGAAG